MKRPALTCKASVSAGLYANWLASEHPHYWQLQADGSAMQRWRLVGEYVARKGTAGAGLGIIPIYEQEVLAR